MIFHHIEQGFVVICPHNISAGAWYWLHQLLASSQVLQHPPGSVLGGIAWLLLIFHATDWKQRFHSVLALITSRVDETEYPTGLLQQAARVQHTYEWQQQAIS
jgi:hypothetical protein